MQPETKVKENGQIKELTPSEQWDQLAFQIIYRELAPKGFKKVTGGSYKGQVIAACDGPGLPKSKVTSTQKIAAQLVRGFREKAKLRLRHGVELSEKSKAKTNDNIRACYFWQFKKKEGLKRMLEYWEGEISSLNDAIAELDRISIK